MSQKRRTVPKNIKAEPSTFIGLKTLSPTAGPFPFMDYHDLYNCMNQA